MTGSRRGVLVHSETVTASERDDRAAPSDASEAAAVVPAGSNGDGADRPVIESPERPTGSIGEGSRASAPVPVPPSPKPLGSGAASPGSAADPSAESRPAIRRGPARPRSLGTGPKPSGSTSAGAKPTSATRAAASRSRVADLFAPEPAVAGRDDVPTIDAIEVPTGSTEAAAPTVDAPPAPVETRPDPPGSAPRPRMAPSTAPAPSAPVAPSVPAPAPPRDGGRAGGPIDLATVPIETAARRSSTTAAPAVEPTTEAQRQRLHGQPTQVVGRRARVRRVTRVVRHVDPWSVFKIAAIFNLLLYGIVLTAGVLLWNVAYATGTIDNVERFMESFGWSDFQFDGSEIFRNAWVAGLFVIVGLTGLAVLAATMFNLITDLVGGVRMTVLEEEVVERQPGGGSRNFLVRRRSGPPGPPTSTRSRAATGSS